MATLLSRAVQTGKSHGTSNTLYILNKAEIIMGVQYATKIHCLCVSLSSCPQTIRARIHVLREQQSQLDQTSARRCFQSEFGQPPG